METYVAVTLEPASSMIAGVNMHTTGVSCNAITLLMTSINMAWYEAVESFMMEISLLVYGNLGYDMLNEDERMRAKKFELVY